jgi:hypothetical protein
VRIIKPTILLLLLCLSASFVQGQAKAVPKPSSDTALIRVDSLKPIIVTSTFRPRMKGDTLEYNTERILMQPNAVVEELLRRLPGLQIDASGNITFNGEKIQYLLVDGEDIFGSDPTMVTRSFDASKIARVQILDRKGDHALFTGIDDGSRTKTLNLVLKESARNGYFGKVETGGNTNDYYNASGALAGFRDKEQFTALGMAGNTGVLSSSYNGGTGISYLYGITDPLGTSAGTGIPKYTAAALHYANTWNGSVDHFSGNYQYSHFNTRPVTEFQTYQTQPDSIYGQYQRTESINQQVQQWIYAIYDWTPDANSALRFKLRGSNTQEQNQFSTTGSSAFNDTLVNSSQRTIQDRMSRQNVGADLAWRIGIGKQHDRIFSITTAYTKINATTNGYLYSLNQFYQPKGLIQSMDTVDQRKQIVSHALNVNGSINYAEPLWIGAVLGLSYGLSVAGDQPLQATFNRGDGEYQEMVDSLSSHLKTQATNQNAVLNLQGKTKHLTYTIGNVLLWFSYRQKDQIADSLLHQHYFNWAPSMMLNYTANQAINFNLNYNASTQQPSITQLAAIKNNNNPLQITVGNPDLKPGFNQSLGLDFHRFKTWGINLSLNLSLSTNSISTKTITDSLGRQISQPVNVGGGKTGGVNFSLDRKILGFETGLFASGTFSQTVTYVNADLSRNIVYIGGGGFSLNKYVPEKYSVQLNANFTYFDQVSSINISAPIHYWTQSHQVALTLFLIRGLDINTNANYAWQEKTSAFNSSTSILLWNGNISRHFIHNKLVVRAQFNNILNENAGISRTNTDNVNTQSSTNILGRFWMLSAIYHFDKKFKKK